MYQDQTITFRQQNAYVEEIYQSFGNEMVSVIIVELTALYSSVYALQVPYYLVHILIFWYHLNVKTN
jgi:hypothetical protein